MKTVASSFAVLLALIIPSYPSYAKDKQIYLCVDADGHKELAEKDKGNCKPLDLPGATQKPAPKKRSAGVRLGMTMDEVVKKGWGKPNRVNRTIDSSGTSEQWVYDGGYLYFTNGVLTTIQN